MTPEAKEPSSAEHPVVEPMAAKPELLDPVLDPDRLLGKLGDLERQAARRDLGALPAEQRLPAGHFAGLSSDIEAEQADPHRVIRASSPAGRGDPPAPPPVIYLSRRPSVSQFMSVI